MERMSVMAVGEKRIKGIDDSFQNASIVLVDIEGTTTSISFVKVIHLKCVLD
jgi:methionine salvage enolase-phosphatase E1